MGSGMDIDINDSSNANSYVSKTDNNESHRCIVSDYKE